MGHEAPLGGQTCPCVVLVDVLCSLPHCAIGDGG